MSYAIGKTEEDKFADFLLNPYLKVTYVGDRIFQKYPNNASMDDVFSFRNGQRGYDLYCRVDYTLKEILVCASYIFYHESSYNPPFVNIYNVRNELQDKIRKDLDDMKIARAAEVRLDPNYMTWLDEYRKTCLDSMVASLLGTRSFCPDISSNAIYAISKFVDSLTIDMILDIRAGNTKLLDEGTELIFYSKNFLISEIIINEIKQEARDIVHSGALSERQKHIQNMAQKINHCGASRFTVETLSGAKVSCRNMIHSNGVLSETGIERKYVDVESVKKIVYSGKTIYQKGVF